MHEVSLVAELVERCEARAAGASVRLVRVRHASSLPAAALRQAFELLTAGGLLADARLETEPFDIHLECGCGFSGALGHEDFISSSLAVCPACGTPSTRPRTAEIELLEVATGPQA